MLIVINLPKKELCKISIAANWTKIANEHDLNIQTIDDTNGKWQFGWKESMTEDEKFLEDDFFGSKCILHNCLSGKSTAFSAKH